MNDPSTFGFPEAARWSLLAGPVGQGFVYAGLALFGLVMLFAVLAGRKPSLERWLGTLFTAGTVCLFGTITILGTLFVLDQFQYEYVRGRAMADTPIAYKIAGIWAGQQGSFLLWACCSALFGVFTLRALGKYKRWYLAPFAGFLAAICGILAYETPFKLITTVIAPDGRVFVPPDGVGLTPALQNYWVVIHPPTIFLGFGSLTVLACWAISAMLTRDLQSWVRPVRPWAIASATILGFGLCLGGFWAYETLGWGGFWAWDPVENVSFVPWLLGIAFFHGLIVQAAQKKWVWTNLLLATLPFLFFVYGTFLTRSGIFGEASVHSFVSMDRVAKQLLLGFLVFSTAGFFALWLTYGRWFARDPQAPAEIDALRRRWAFTLTAVAATGATLSLWTSFQQELRMATGAAFAISLVFLVRLLLDRSARLPRLEKAPLSSVEAAAKGATREGMYRSGMILMSAIAIATAVGMSIPAISVLLGDTQKVPKEHDYHVVLVWFFIPWSLLMAAAPFVSWRTMAWKELFNRLFGVLCVSIGLTGFALFFMRDPRWGTHTSENATVEGPFNLSLPLLPWVTFLVFLAIFTAVANSWRLAEVAKRSKMQMGGFLSHVGVAVLLAGMFISRGLERSERGYVAEEIPTRLLDYVLTFRGFTRLSYPVNLESGESVARYGYNVRLNSFDPAGRTAEVTIVDGTRTETAKLQLGGQIEGRSHPNQIQVGGTIARLVGFPNEMGEPRARLVLQSSTGVNDRDNKVRFTVASAQRTFLALPGLYYTPGENGAQNPMVWPHIDRQISHDTYVALHEPITEIWEEPQSLKPGETKKVAEVEVTYRGMRFEGQPGMAGTRIVADVTVKADGQTFEASPYLVLGQGGARPEMVPVGKDLTIVVTSFNPADQAAEFQVLMAYPVYPIELFYKPMTILVWLGVGIMTLGGFWAAAARRVKGRTPEVGLGPEDVVQEKPSAIAEEEPRIRDDAPVATP